MSGHAAKRSEASGGDDAVDEISALAGLPGSIFSAEEADAYSLTDLPSPHIRADGIDSPYHLVPGHSRKGKPWKLAVYSYTVGVTDPARFNAKSYLPRTWLDKRTNHLSELSRGSDFVCLVG